jgi:carbamate kinase
MSLVRESEGMIGYLIEQALSNELPGREIATLLTQVEVDSADPAFAKPSKPIGPIYGEVEARQLATRTSWTFVPDGRGFRRAVPSPVSASHPRDQRHKAAGAIGMIVICAGGGGIPVVCDGGWSAAGHRGR